MKRAILVSLIIAASVAIPTGAAQAARCSDFTHQEDAQAFYAQNNTGTLDRDNDGIACEALPSRGTTATPAIAPAPRI